MMRLNSLAIILSLLIFSNCKNGNDVLTLNQEQAISDTLKTIATGFLKSWEPPFYPEQALKYFTQTEDFSLIIDGLWIDNCSEWAEGVPDFMADDKSFFISYKHEIKDIKTAVLNKDAGVVTIIYIWDSVTTEGVHRKTDGAITLTCRREQNGWRIVHYHGSHGEDRIIE